MKKTALVALLVAVSGVALIGISAFISTPVLVWNASASAPIGLYRIVSGTPKRGDVVLIRPPDFVEKLAAGRGYLPAGVPLIKRIAAMGSDDVCAFDSAVIINGHAVAYQLEHDSAGRSLPRWNECRVLKADEYFLLNEAENSFDSRYVGPVPRAQIIGRLVPLWTE